MNSRERIAAACAHTEPDKLPVDFGGGFQTGIHVSMVYQLRQALGLDPPGTPVKVVEIYQMLGEIAPDLRDALGIDTVSLHGTGHDVRLPADRLQGVAARATARRCSCPRTSTRSTSRTATSCSGPANDRSRPAERPHAGRRLLLRRDHPAGADRRGAARPGRQHRGVRPGRPTTSSRTTARWPSALCDDTDRALFCTLRRADLRRHRAGARPPFLKRPQGHPRHRGVVRQHRDAPATTSTRCSSGRPRSRSHNLARLHAAVGDRAAVIQTNGTDFGTQNGPFCSPETLPRAVPALPEAGQRLDPRRTRRGRPSCTAAAASSRCSTAIVEAGFDILNPVQCSAAGMDPRELKRRFGDRLVFWGGGVDTQKTLPVRHARSRCATRCASGSRSSRRAAASSSAPSTTSRRETPIENLLAMFDVVSEYR